MAEVGLLIVTAARPVPATPVRAATINAADVVMATCVGSHALVPIGVPLLPPPPLPET